MLLKEHWERKREEGDKMLCVTKGEKLFLRERQGERRNIFQ